MRILLFIPMLLIMMTGCGSNAPDLAAVKKSMSSEQLAVGDPIENSVGMVLIPIPAGEFRMGSAKPKKGRFEKSEAPKHLVKITKPYYLSVCEVTQQQYENVMGTRPWQGNPLVEEGPNYAATYIAWKDAVEFCRKLSEQENVEYRLPTEAEWEYACRAGTTKAYSFDGGGGELENHGWYDKNAYKDGEQYAHRVGQKIPNPWALYDMHGNVCEWCQDWYAGYGRKQEQAVDPTGPKKGRVRVWRGGNFADAGGNARSASRLSHGRVGYRSDFAAGFRVVRIFSTSE